MRIVFFGSGSFSIPALDFLCNQSKYVLVAIVTQPDRKAGRGYKLQYTAVKDYFLKSGISTHLFQPENINSPEFISILKELKPDLFVVASFGQILGKDILSLPRIFAINIHASLLPKYRGAAPINWAIINGEEITGITIFKMNAKMDAGEIISQRRCEISFQDTAITLEKKLALLGRNLLEETLETIGHNKFCLQHQEGKPSYAPRLKKEDGLITWEKSALEIYNLIRGTQPWPSAYTYLGGKLLKIFRAEIVEENEGRRPGEVVTADKEDFVVACGKGALKIRELQPESRKKMSWREFLAGYKIQPGMKLGT